MQSWGRLGRILIRIGFAGFAAYIAIVGPSVVFGNYQGSESGFLAQHLLSVGADFSDGRNHYGDRRQTTRFRKSKKQARDRLARWFFDLGRRSERSDFMASGRPW